MAIIPIPPTAIHTRMGILRSILHVWNWPSAISRRSLSMASSIDRRHFDVEPPRSRGSRNGKLRPTLNLSSMAGDAEALMVLMRGIVAGDAKAVARSLAASPALASSSLREGATRHSSRDYFFDEIAHYLFA